MKLYVKVLILLLLIIPDTSIADQWEQLPNFGGEGRHRAIGLSIGYKGYLGLGHYNGTGVETYLSDWWEFDLASNAWTQRADFIGNNGNGELGALGIGLETAGYVGVGELDPSSFYKYDPITNTWTQVASPGSVFFQDSKNFVIDHKGYFLDLISGLTYEYDADLDFWSTKSAYPFPWNYTYSAFTINGKGYLKTMNDIFEYDPILDTWTYKNYFPGHAILSSINFVQNGKGYLVCGFGQGGNPDLTSQVWEYDPIANSWNWLPDFPGSSRRYSVGFNIGNRCFLGTGTNGTNFNDFWEFNATASVDEEKSTDRFMVYPTPATDQVTISHPNIQEFNIELSDQTGKICFQAMTNNGTVVVPRNNLPSGIYYYTIINNGASIHSQKISFN